MNIFVLDYNPVRAAIHMVDKHVMSKMIVESAQILSNCFTDEQLAHPSCPRTQKGTVRKHSYPHHPCSKWVQESKTNMWWVIYNSFSMDGERMVRWKIKNPSPTDICPPHFSIPFIDWCEVNIKKSKVPDSGITPFVQCMPEEYKNPDPVIAYRNYYRYGKKHLHKWTRNKPSWITSDPIQDIRSYKFDIA